MKHILYLASGNSRRFGKNKLLINLKGKPLYRHGLDTMLEVMKDDPECTLTVVSQYSEIRERASELGVRYADSPESCLGMSYTIRAGIYSLENVNENDFLLFVVADQPNLKAESVKKLFLQAKAGTETARLYCGSRPGNPVLFSGSLIPELLALKEDQGGGFVARKHACIPVYISDPDEFSDIDIPNDLENN